MYAARLREILIDAGFDQTMLYARTFAVGVNLSVLERAGELLNDPLPDDWKNRMGVTPSMVSWAERNAKQIVFLTHAGVLKDGHSH